MFADCTPCAEVDHLPIRAVFAGRYIYRSTVILRYWWLQDSILEQVMGQCTTKASIDWHPCSSPMGKRRGMKSDEFYGSLR